MTATDLFNSYLTGVVGLLAISNPFSTAPLLISLLPASAEAERRAVSRRASIYMAVILIGTLFVGSTVMHFFGISLPGLRVAGGLVVAYVGFHMLFGDPGRVASLAEGAEGKADVALIPLAMPSLSGPGSIAVVISVSAEIAAKHSLLDKGVSALIYLLTILTVAVIAFVVLRSAGRISNWLGPSGIESVKRVMGFLLVCIGVQFVAVGIEGFIAGV
ncbi:MAG TPA: MarC family NAAT transporter [Pelomicrobium sp.]|nr:MarC family NAAT transporter [Pelomicrobium sp.]